MNLLTDRNRLTDLENEFIVARGLGEGKRQGTWDGHLHTVEFKMEPNKDLLYSTGNSAQCHVTTKMGKKFEKEWIHVYV